MDSIAYPIPLRVSGYTCQTKDERQNKVLCRAQRFIPPKQGRDIGVQLVIDLEVGVDLIPLYVTWTVHSTPEFQDCLWGLYVYNGMYIIYMHQWEQMELSPSIIGQHNYLNHDYLRGGNRSRMQRIA